VSLQQRSAPSEVIVDLVAGCPSDAIKAIAVSLESGELTLESTSVGISSLRSVDAQTASRCASAFARLRGLIDGSVLAMTLRAAVGLRDAERLTRPAIEIVWTGPEAEGPLVRPTLTVLEEMLRGVREAGEILLVGYSLTAQDGTPPAGVIDLLGEASRRRALVTMILHRDEHARNRENLLAAWDVRAVKPRLLTWDPPADFPYTKLHAKVLVVDRLDALVTSANLTLHGLTANLELGLRVRGPQAPAIALRFDHLIASGVITEWT
jgi:hypothetical protein